MFLEKYVSYLYLNIIYSNYAEDYINGLDEEKFIKIYNLFKEYNFYFINDIILNYLEIFEMDADEVEDKLIELKEKLGNNFVQIIGNDTSYLDEFLND